MSNSALHKVHGIVSEMNSQAYSQGIKFERERILDLLDNKRASLEERAVWSVMSPEKSQQYLNQIDDLDSIVDLIKKEAK